MKWIRYKESSSYIDIGEESADRHPAQLPNEVAVHPVCRVKKGIHGERYAKLIKAVPFMLAALKAARGHVYNSPFDNAIPTYQLIEDAIAEAEGEQ